MWICCKMKWGESDDGTWKQPSYSMPSLPCFLLARFPFRKLSPWAQLRKSDAMNSPPLRQTEWRDIEISWISASPQNLMRHIHEGSSNWLISLRSKFGIQSLEDSGHQKMILWMERNPMSLLFSKRARSRTWGSAGWPADLSSWEGMGAHNCGSHSSKSKVIRSSQHICGKGKILPESLIAFSNEITSSVCEEETADICGLVQDFQLCLL